MIARFQVLLPYRLSVPFDREFEAYNIEAGGYPITVYVPHRAPIDHTLLEPDSPGFVGDISRNLDPVEPQPHTPLVRVEGSETVQADVLRLDFLKGGFDRAPGTDDPPIELCFQVAKELLARLRTLGRASQIKPIDYESTIWHIRYLRDDESELEPTEGLLRARFGVSWKWRIFALRPDLWARAKALPDDFRPTPWDTLLLDAVGLVPEIGPALVLAYAAVETRIATALDVLAYQAGLSSELWEWITEREGDYRKEPSIREQVDPLLRACSGHSLKDDARLWEAFQNLRTARNTFVHEGRAMIGDDVITRERASQLVALTGDIIDWIEALLPEAHRRPRDPREREAMVELMRNVIPPEPPEEGAQINGEAVEET